MGQRSYHGMSKWPEYQVFLGMIKRCENPNSTSYGNYGGRGIGISAEWRHNFAAFIAHVGRRPSSQHSIERIDNNLGYQPGNVKWALVDEQRRNTRRNRVLELDGRKMLATDWANELSLSTSLISNRLKRGASNALAPIVPGRRKDNRLITLNGETRSCPEWSRITGISMDALWSRIIKGFPPEKILYKGES